MRDVDFPIDKLRELLRYCPATGILTWRLRPVELFNDTPGRSREHACNHWNARHAGKPAGAVDGNGYLAFGFLRVETKAHRVAWALHHGRWPVDKLDHENGCRTDNRIANLSEATNATNMLNKRLYATNTSGAHGVTWYRPYGKWVAYIRRNGKRKHIGYFDDLEAAIRARKAAEAGAFHKNHGRAA